MARNRRRPAGRKSDGLEVCPACGRDFVQAVSWEPVGQERWWIFLRCAECGISREVLVTNAEANRFDDELHARASVLSREVRRLEGERIEGEAKAFFAALDHDLIDPGDFAR